MHDRYAHEKDWLIPAGQWHGEAEERKRKVTMKKNRHAHDEALIKMPRKPGLDLEIK